MIRLLVLAVAVCAVALGLVGALLLVVDEGRDAQPCSFEFTTRIGGDGNPDTLDLLTTCTPGAVVTCPDDILVYMTRHRLKLFTCEQRP